METRASWILLSVMRVLWRRVIKPVAKPSWTIVLLSVLTAATWAQSQPSTLTPSRDSANPGATVRINVEPSLGANQPTGSRLLLRSARGQREGADIELRIMEWHVDWLRALIPRDARTDAGAMLLVLLDRRNNVIADSRNRFFRVVEASDTGPLGRAAPKPGPVPSPDPLPPDRSADKTTRPVPDATPRKVDPRPAPEVPTKQPTPTTPGVTAKAKDPTLLTTPGVEGQAKRLPIQVADYVAIGVRDLQLRDNVTYPTVFNLPADVRLEGPAVLMFMANPEQGGVIINLTVSINGHEVKSIRFREGTMHARCISFNAKGVLLAGRNEIVFKKHGGGLSLSIDDIVLWFHRDVNY